MSTISVWFKHAASPNFRISGKPIAPNPAGMYVLAEMRMFIPTIN